MNETTLTLIKPDAITKGLVGVVLNSINGQGLEIQETTRIQLNQMDLEALYSDLLQEPDLYSKLAEFLTSAPVIIMKVSGEDAIHRTKYRAIGKYHSLAGLRNTYSESLIKNVAHASDSPESAARELQHFEPRFQKEKKMNQERFKNITVFALAGMSECGKSTVGKYLDSKEVPRLKIGAIFEAVKNRESPAQDLIDFISEQEQKNPLALWDSFIDELIGEMQILSAKNVSIESLYGGGLGTYLKQKLGKSFCLVFIDIPLEIRLKRQMIREGLDNIKEAKKILLPRDQFKIDTGTHKLKEIADEVIDNSGTIEQLYEQIDNLVSGYCK